MKISYNLRKLPWHYANDAMHLQLLSKF